MLPSHNSIQKKDNKVGNKTTNKLNKEGKEGKKRAREKDRNQIRL